MYSFHSICVLFLLTNSFQTNAEKFKVTSEIFMNIAEQNGKQIGQIIFGLFGELAPKTVENFRTICLHGINGKSYKGSIFHRVIDRFIIQGGDIVSHNGFGSLSIYGKYFEDEYLEINHTISGFLGMSNRGPDTNGCQFYINTIATPWLNQKHTIFGKVIKGQKVVHIIEKSKTDTDDFPIKPMVISDCGEIPISGSYVISDNPYDHWGWLKASTVPLGMSFSILAFFQWVIRQLNKHI